MKAFYGTVNQKLLVAEEYKAVDSFFTQIYIFSNGVWASYLDDAGQPFNGTNRSHLSINIPQYNQSWAGEYTVVFYSYCHDVVYTLLQGCSYNQYFICHNLLYAWESVLQVNITTLGKK